LGQLSDPSALSLVRRTFYPRSGQPSTFDVLLLRRWQPGTFYPQVIKDVSDLMLGCGRDGRNHFPGCRLVLDATGVGRPVCDLFREIPGLRERVVAITITGGQAASYDGPSASYHVGKVELVAALQALQGQGRFRIAADVPDAKELAKELGTFSSKLTPTGQLTYEHWRTTDKDDLVLAVVLPLWYGRTALCVGRDYFDDPQLSEGYKTPTKVDEHHKWVEM
jgi:hypothetical protein